MTDEDEERQKQIKELLEHADKQIATQHTELLDFQHHATMRMREVVTELIGFKDRFEDLIDNIIITHVTAAKQVADIYGDIILAENGLRSVDPEDEDEEDAEIE